MSQQCSQLLLIFDRGNPVEFWLERPQPLLIDRCAIHASGVVVANLLLVGRTIRSWGRRLFEHVMQDVLVMVVENCAGAVSRTIVRNRIVLGEIPARILKEVRTRIRGSIEKALVQSGWQIRDLFFRSAALGLCQRDSVE